MGAEDFRTTVSRVLDEFADEGTLRAVLTDALSLERLTGARCPCCGERVQLASPDYRGWLAALTAFDGIGKGKQKPPEDERDDDERIEAAVMRVLERMTDEELERLPA